MWTLIVIIALIRIAAGLTGGTYDYIVVGGGTAGLVVANRLSEVSDVNVLVLEAGSSALQNVVSSDAATFGDYPGPVRKPMNAMEPSAIDQAQSLNWDYTTVPQKYGLNEVQNLPAGRGVGGSSLINGMVYSRAVMKQIDAWQLAGNVGWNWKNLLWYAMKSEHFQYPGETQKAGGVSFDPQVHGSLGLLSTGYSTKQLAADEYFPSALNSSYQNASIPYNVDMNGGTMRGFSAIPATINITNGNDVRADAGRSYFYPFSSRGNLHLIENITVRRILWKEHKNLAGNVLAGGVEALASDGSLQIYNASREIIISCGSFATPPLLERSGIGNPSILSKHGIDAKVDLPGVGENLMDQPSSNFTHRLDVDVSDKLGTFVAYLNVQDIFRENSSSFASTVENSLPDYAKALADQNNNSTGWEDILNLLRIQYSVIFNALVPLVEVLHHAQGDILTSEFWGTSPFARGQIHITSNDTLSPPDINPNYWMFPYDTATSIGAARFIRGLIGPESMQNSIGEELTPGPTNLPSNASDGSYERWLKQSYHTGYHSIGSAIMLPRAIGGVVSNHTVVYGTANVRVVDASIIPFQTNGHTQAIVYALAEQASDIIKADGGL